MFFCSIARFEHNLRRQFVNDQGQLVIKADFECDNPPIINIDSYIS